MKKILLYAFAFFLMLSSEVCAAQTHASIPDSEKQITDELKTLRQENEYLRSLLLSCLETDLTVTGTENRCVNSAEFIEDVTIPDGTVIGPGEPFRKIWRLRNTGTCTWNRSYRVVSSGQFHMGGPQFSYLAGTVQPGETADIVMDLVSPVIYGSFESEYLLEDAEGNSFGITGTRTKAEMPFWLKLTVADISKCSLVRVTPYAAWRYADFDAVFRVKNNSGEVWDANEVDVVMSSGLIFLKYPEKITMDLPETVEPGEVVSVIYDMIAPDTEGDYWITVDFVKNGAVICSATNRITVL